MRVRKLEASEWKQLRELRLRALANAPYAFRSDLGRELEFPEAQWRDWAKSNALGEAAICFVAESEAGDLCAMAVGLFGGTEDDLVAMWVAPDLRRRGIGRVLVEHVAEWARGKGLASMGFWVREQNVEAVRFYEQLDFILTGERREEEGVFELRMEREI